MSTRRPSPDEFTEYYHAYVGQVPDGNIISILTEQHDRIVQILTDIPTSKEDFKYADGKWSTKEVIGHMLDTEWIFSYRTLRIARNDQTPMAAMDQDEFVRGANFDNRSLASMTTEFSHLRSATIELVSSFDDDILDRTGTASGYPFTVRALVFIIAGHAEHHINVLSEKYL